MARKSLAERFWEKVDIRGPDECWEWLGYKDHAGYGEMRVDGKRQRSTHVLWYLRHGEYPPKGRLACHKCDNPSCLNPKHLYLGSQQSNVRDKVQRGRQAKGEQAGPAMTEAQVHAIRAGLERGETQKSIAHWLRVTTRTIGNISRRKTWKHLPEHPSSSTGTIST